MIGTIYVRCNAAHPENALPTMASFVGSPSSIRVLDVPKKIGSWQINAVQLNVVYPDTHTHTIHCQQASSAWVGTLPPSTEIGESKKGFTITASGTDENGNAVSGYVLGVGDISIIGMDGQIIISNVAHYMHFLSAEPDIPQIADAYSDNGIVKLYDGNGWIPLNDMSEYLLSSDFANLSGNFLTAHQSLSDYYTKNETSSCAELSSALSAKADTTSLSAYLPLSGGTVNGDIEFANGKSMILPMNGNQFTYSIYGRNGSTARYYQWKLRAGTYSNPPTLATHDDLSNSLSSKLDCEISSPTRNIPLGLYYEDDPSEVVYTDLILENDGEFSEGRNRYNVEFEGDGVYVECSYARQTRRTLVENLTTGESTDTVNRSIWFGIGDVGEIADGDGDTENICVVADVTEILPSVRLTVGQSIENRLENYYTKTQTSSVAELQTAFGKKADKSSLSDLSSSCIRRNANTITTPGVVTDYLASNLVGGVRVRFSAHNLDNYTAYAYNGVAVRRNASTDDYLFDSSQNGIARMKDISAIVEAYLAQNAG